MQSAGEVSAVPERAKQGTDTHKRDWSWVEASVWTQRMLAALDEGVKGGKWFSLIDKVYRDTTLAVGWQKVRANRGAAGVDGQSVAGFAAHAERYLGELEEQWKSGQYEPQPVRRVEIPKGPGKVRALGIPVVKDRVVQAALKVVIEPILEREFLEVSYGFRPGRSCKQALREVDRWLKEGYCHVVDADLRSYFDTIPHERLMQRLGQSISDGRLLALVERYLRQDVMTAMNSWRPTAGTPQGAVISPLLANLYLHSLDERLVGLGYKLVRYADDFVVLCQSAEQARAALEQVRAWVEENGLRLNEDKTHVGDCRIQGEGFDFLGYRFEAGRREVRRKSLQALREKIRAKTPRNRGQSLARIIAELNPMLRGWFAYFQHARASTFDRIDGFIRRRLRALLRRHERRPGFGRCQRDHARWPNAFFAAQGLFTLATAHAQARQSR